MLVIQNGTSAGGSTLCQELSTLDELQQPRHLSHVRIRLNIGTGSEGLGWQVAGGVADDEFFLSYYLKG